MEHRIQMDCIYEKKDVTMRYESVMGKAEAVFLEGEEKQVLKNKYYGSCRTRVADKRGMCH